MSFKLRINLQDIESKFLRKDREKHYLWLKMKFMTTNFVKCSIKTCDSSTDSFPLKYQNCTLVQEELEFNPEFITSILDRLDWDAILKVAHDVSICSLSVMDHCLTVCL